MACTVCTTHLHVLHAFPHTYITIYSMVFIIVQFEQFFDIQPVHICALVTFHCEGFMIPYRSLEWSTLWIWSIVGVVAIAICSVPQVLIMRCVHKVGGYVTTVCPFVCLFVCLPVLVWVMFSRLCNV